MRTAFLDNHIFLLLLVLLFTSSKSLYVSFTLASLKYIPFSLNLLDFSVEMNLTLSVNYTVTNSNGDLSQVNIYSAAIQGQQIFNYSVWNFENFDQILIITISNQNLTNLTEGIIQLGPQLSQALFTAVFDKDTSGGYMYRSGNQGSHLIC